MDQRKITFAVFRREHKFSNKMLVQWPASKKTPNGILEWTEWVGKAWWSTQAPISSTPHTHFPRFCSRCTEGAKSNIRIFERIRMVLDCIKIHDYLLLSEKTKSWRKSQRYTTEGYTDLLTINSSSSGIFLLPTITIRLNCFDFTNASTSCEPTAPVAPKTNALLSIAVNTVWSKKALQHSLTWK